MILAAALAAFALAYDWGLLVPLIAGGGICVWYSARLKHRPFWDIATMVVWGTSMPLCGAPIIRQAPGFARLACTAADTGAGLEGVGRRRLFSRPCQ